MAGTTKFVLGILMIVFFSFALTAFISSFINTTNPSSDMITKYKIDKFANNLNDTINNYKLVTDKQLSTLNKTNVEVKYLFLFSLDLFYIPLTILRIVISGISTIFSFLTFGIGGTLGSILAMTVLVIISGLGIQFILLLIKTLRTGESER